ncbi:DegT/DnrJ/EryC1/StrS family aminotransferase, partial [Patescibacteria group bacterium]|nr:DegT/DnrJ/EryC1/StrS family aminotransferase [Patescibacteria group bacterium]
HSSKMISALEGGIIATNDEELYRRLLNIYDVGDINRAERTKPAKEITYDMTFSFRPSELNFIWGYLQLNRLRKFIKERQEIAKMYIQRLDKEKYDIPRYDSANVYYRFIVGLKSSNVVRLLKYLREHRIETGRGIYPLLTAYVPRAGKLRNAEQVIGRSVSVPLYPGLSQKEVNRIIHAFNSYEE